MMMKLWREKAELEARSIDEFKAIAHAMGYKEKWADYRYRELRGAHE